MSASLSGVFNLQEFTDLGALGAGMRLYTYAPATTTLKVAYTDAAGTIPHTYTSDGLGGQYIALNARGELPAPLFLLVGGYDLTLKTQLGATLWTRRAIGGDDAAAAGIASLLATFLTYIGSSLIGFIQAGVGAVLRTAQDKLRERRTVLDYIDPANQAAALAGTFDTTSAINAAIAACIPGAPTFSFGGVDYYLANSSLEFSPGRYRVTGTVGLSGFGPTKKVVGLRIFGPRLTPVYAGGNTILNPAAATIIADSGASWAADQAVVGLQNCHYCTIDGIAVKGIYGTTRGIDMSNGVGWGVDSVSLYQHKYGEYHNLSSGLHSRNLGASNCSHAALYLKDSGDSDIESPFINTCNQDYLTDANQGIGIYIATSNNTNVRGGKIEYCSIGVYLNDTQGINLTGTNYDCNGQCHILASYDSTSGTTANALQLKSITITGNRFLAGGHLVGTLARSHINVYGNMAPVNVVITGNSFRKGSGLAFDENTGGAQPVGPGLACIYVDHQGNGTYDVGLAVSGNDLWNGSVSNAIVVSAPNGANVRIKGDNLTNLPNFVTGASVVIGDPATISVMSTATYSVSISERDLIANRAGTITVTLPDPAANVGRRIGIRTVQAQAVNSASANVVPRPDLAAGSAILPAVDGAWAEMVSDGTAYQIVASN